MSKEDMALNNQQWLICHKTQPNQISILVLQSAGAFLEGEVRIDTCKTSRLWLLCLLPIFYAETDVYILRETFAIFFSVATEDINLFQQKIKI